MPCRCAPFRRPNTKPPRTMDKLLIQGGRPLQGKVVISGAKNAALPILCASLLTADPLELDNVPALRDIGTTLTLLQRMGVRAERKGETHVTDRKSVV